MNKISATEAKQSLGMLLDNVQHQPIEIQRQGRGVAVILSLNEYLSLKKDEMTDEQVLKGKLFLKKWSGKFKKNKNDDFEEKIKHKIDPTHEEYDPKLDYLLHKHVL